MNEVYLAGAAIGGAVVAGILGWFKSATPFSGRKLGATVIRALIAGAGFAALQNYTGAAVTVATLATAFVSGAGFDALGHRVAGTIKPT